MLSTVALKPLMFQCLNGHYVQRLTNLRFPPTVVIYKNVFLLEKKKKIPRRNGYNYKVAKIPAINISKNSIWVTETMEIWLIRCIFIYCSSHLLCIHYQKNYWSVQRFMSTQLLCKQVSSSKTTKLHDWDI